MRRYQGQIWDRCIRQRLHPDNCAGDHARGRLPAGSWSPETASPVIAGPQGSTTYPQLPGW